VSRGRFLVEIGGAEVRDLYPDITEVEVELDDQDAATFRIELTMALQPNGSWRHADDPRLTSWAPVAIGVGVADGIEPLLSGHLTGVRAGFDGDLGRCRLELQGSDGSALLDRVERLRAWPDKKDSDIAAEIFTEYGLTPQVEATTVVHGADRSTILQRETDLQFLQRLARRNGFDCWVEHGQGCFRAPDPAAAAQPGLAVHFGGETNVGWFRVQVDARRPAEIGMFQLDRSEKTVLSAVVTAADRPALGADDGTRLLPGGVPPARAFVAMNASTGLAEMDPLCRSLFDRAGWFVSAEGVLDGSRYGAVLRPRRPVTIKGVGERHSGSYAVTHVTHTLNRAGYTQRFAVKRNGLRPTGAEDFGGGPALPGIGRP
jgi:hypothetical protein